MTADSALPPARFDSLDRKGRSFVFEEPVGEVAAWTLDEVLPAIREVQSAGARGLHAAGFIAYEAAPAFDHALVTHPPVPGLPLAWFGLYARRSAASPADAPASSTAGAAHVGPWSPSISAKEHARRVRRIRDLIAAGDTYQVNLTFGLEAAFDGDVEALYRVLCGSQRAGYCALLRAPFGTVVSLSPELFFRWSGRDLALRPMKGTRPRGRWVEEDEELARELLDSEKERAENLMIVDLLRNDAGRVAEVGSVAVPSLFEVERYPTVHQLTSTVTARTRRGTRLEDLLEAVFPSGSVTGAPKVRTMEIIRELEAGPRGVYTGAVGFVSPDETVFNVPIRTLFVERGEAAVRMGVGSGITYGSDPAAELAECMHKAAFVHRRASEVELLETLRYDPETGYHLLDEHLRRLGRSGRYFGFHLDLSAIRRALEEAAGQVSGREGDAGGTAVAEPRSLRVRLVVAADGRPRIERERLTPLPSVLRARLSMDPIDSSSPLIYHKTTAREVYRRRLAAHPGYDEVLLTNERAELTEFTTGNVILVIEGERLTPPVESGLLSGVAREVLLAEGRLAERVLTPADLARAEAVYLVNSVRDIIPVRVDI